MIDESLNVIMSHKRAIDDEIQTLLTQVAGLRKKAEALESAFHTIRDGAAPVAHVSTSQPPPLAQRDKYFPEGKVLRDVREALQTAPNGEGYTTTSLADMLYPPSIRPNRGSVKSAIRKALKYLTSQCQVKVSYPEPANGRLVVYHWFEKGHNDPHPI